MSASRAASLATAHRATTSLPVEEKDLHGASEMSQLGTKPRPGWPRGQQTDFQRWSRRWSRTSLPLGQGPLRLPHPECSTRSRTKGSRGAS